MRLGTLMARLSFHPLTIESHQQQTDRFSRFGGYLMKIEKDCLAVALWIWAIPIVDHIPSRSVYQIISKPKR